MQRPYSRFGADRDGRPLPSPSEPVPSGSILLYGFGLALAFSLVFNGFLLYEQSHYRRIYEYDVGNPVYPADQLVWQQQLSDCQRASQQKDSLIYQLKQVPNTPPGRGSLVQGTASR